MNASTYVPGVCNIGKQEIQQRKQIGWLGLALTVVLWIVFSRTQLSSGWYLLLFFPAAASAVGFLQAYLHFCAAFGLQGVFNMGSQLRKTETVQQAEFRAQDRKKAQQIFAYTILIGILTALLAYFIH